jgi:hypothetical protein
MLWYQLHIARHAVSPTFEDKDEMPPSKLAATSQIPGRRVLETVRVFKPVPEDAVKAGMCQQDESGYLPGYAARRIAKCQDRHRHQLMVEQVIGNSTYPCVHKVAQHAKVRAEK